MSENTTAASDLASQYAAQVTGDLDRNEKEQERIGAEIAALQEQLANLQQDHAVLVNMRQALGVTPAPATVPAPRTKSARGKKTAAPAPAKPKTKKPAGSKSTTTTKSASPTLVDLVRAHLTDEGERPRSAAEVATTLGQSHPDRSFKTTVVRNTLENLVARGQAQRTKQGNSVFYTAPGTTAETAPAPSEGNPSEEAQSDKA